MPFPRWLKTLAATRAFYGWRGDFVDARLTAMMQNGKAGRHFVFSVTVNDGVMKGKASEIRGTQRQGVGELVMRKVAAKP